MPTRVTRTRKEFNDEVRFAINSSVFGLVGDQVLKALYAHLKEYHGIAAEEIPYRLNTLLATLEETFGVAGVKTIGRAIAKRFYFRMGLEFFDEPNYSLEDYLEHAKKLLLDERDVVAPRWGSVRDERVKSGSI